MVKKYEESLQNLNDDTPSDDPMNKLSDFKSSLANRVGDSVLRMSKTYLRAKSSNLSNIKNTTG